MSNLKNDTSNRNNQRNGASASGAYIPQKMLELKDVASIFYASGTFTDIKSDSNAVKIMVV